MKQEDMEKELLNNNKELLLKDLCARLPKFKVRDKAFWVGYDGNWYEGEIFGVFIYDGGIKYAIKEQKIKNRIFLIYVDEQDLFLTKEQLLKSL